MPLPTFNMEKLNDTFNWPVFYRELAFYVKQKEEYERSLKYFDESLKKEPDNIRALHGRSIARAKSIKFAGASEDIKKILTIDPDNIYLKAEKALITYLRCEFEEALIQNFRNVPLRKKPDNFVMGVMHCEDAILNCISDRAGKPLRDHFKLIRKIAWFKTIQKQRPYKPVAKFRKKRKKSVHTALPTTQTKKNKRTEKQKSDLEAHKYEKHHRKPSTESEVKLITASIANMGETSSIQDSLYSHYSSLQNLRVPKGPSFPYKPLQNFTSNIENYLAEKYLDKLYLDKLFLKNLPGAAGAIIANTRGSNKIKQLARQGFNNVYHAQEMLRSRRPFYFIKYQEATSRGQLEARGRETLEVLRNMALKQANKVLMKLENAVIDRKLRQILESGEKLVHFCENTSKKVFPTRQWYLSRVVSLVCDGFYETRKFSPHMSDQQKEDRIRIIISLPMDRAPSTDSLANDLKGWFVDWKKMTAIYNKRLFKVTTAEELAWVYHELARFSIELKQYELARMYARKCITEANLGKNLKWILNAMLLIVRIDVCQKNKNDAKSQVKHAKKVANRLRDDDLAEILDMCVDVIEQSSLDDALGIKVLEMREKQIINLLGSQAMKDDAAYLFRRIATLPVSKRMSVMPGFTYTEEKAKKSSSSSESIATQMSKKSESKKAAMAKKRGVAFLDLIQ